MSVIYPRVYYNRLKGVIATFDTFDTNPSDPSNMTDEDFTTETGEGVETVTTATGLNRTLGNIKFDMGAAHPVQILVQVNVHRDSGDGTIACFVDQSDDGTTWLAPSTFITSRAGAEEGKSKTCLVPMAYARYIRLRFTSSSVTLDPSVFHVKVSEVMALELP